MFCHLCNKVFGHRQLGKRVLFILVFLIEKLWARKDVVFYGINCLFFLSVNHYCLRELHITCEQKINRLKALIETKYRSMPF